MAFLKKDRWEEDDKTHSLTVVFLPSNYNYEHRALDPSDTSRPVVPVFRLDEIYYVCRADDRGVAGGFTDMVPTFYRDMRDPGRHRADRAVANRHQAWAHAAGCEPVDRDHDRCDGDIRDDEYLFRHTAVRGRAIAVGRGKGPVERRLCLGETHSPILVSPPVKLGVGWKMIKHTP